ncbi:hypothetical protein CYLTODRAFT_440959 [Cylindrobasidium torrendii FP15055 ss-10]|uniref:Uncharacterized protein n=1 Tax=Cylindrobasidium torrendii FP15055 ss-10 TaxID=1314674 RepID=A0A0D7BQI2_9AGAR|nr:hypothetical protein CYLTODRAFT_440959 [Cylindrobasidium torrendii FP15055 ss-10]
MGFLKKFFSLGHKKAKKQRNEAARNEVDEAGLNMDFRYRPPHADSESEAIANKLLRSASARFATMGDTAPSELPPLPHPIDRVLRGPKASTSSINSGSYSQSSYKVTVHQKQHHPSSAYSPQEDSDDLMTPKPRRTQRHIDPDSSGVLRLRSDPSVASLLDLYDSHGCLSDEAFSNTSPSPPSTPVARQEDTQTKEGRAQVRRNGSTLRQLLGSPAASSGDGDISWAERFLGEDSSRSACSSNLSLVLQTPQTSEYEDQHVVIHDDTTFSELDHSFNDARTFSSMDAEASNVSQLSGQLDNQLKSAPGPVVVEPATPQKAIDVFGFLAERRRSRPPESMPVDYNRDLPDPPSCFSSPSDAHEVGPSRYSAADTSFGVISLNTNESEAPAMKNPLDDSIIDIFTSYQRAQRNPLVTPVPQEKVPVTAATSHETEAERQVKVLFTNPQTVMVTAPTPGHYMEGYESRIPRGPRAHKSRSTHERRSSRTHSPRAAAAEEAHRHASRAHKAAGTPPKDRFTSIPSRPRKMQPRVSSNSSSRSNRDKENGSSTLMAKTDIPHTPMRMSSNSSTSKLLRSVITPTSFIKPTKAEMEPDLSADLSPIGKDLMREMRRQRSTPRFGPRDRHV